jgi:hypothetical protein
MFQVLDLNVSKVDRVLHLSPRLGVSSASSAARSSTTVWVLFPFHMLKLGVGLRLRSRAGVALFSIFARSNAATHKKSIPPIKQRPTKVFLCVFVTPHQHSDVIVAH